MKEHFSSARRRLGVSVCAACAAGCLAASMSAALAGDHPSRGLWVGEAILNRVNEVPVDINAANVAVAPNPSLPTPTADKANLRLIVHVDGDGHVRLLKSVAALNKSTNGSASIALVTDDTLYPNFNGNGKRIASAAYDFGEVHASELLTNLATAVAQAAGTNNPAVALARANTAATQLLIAANVDAAYRAFATSNILRNAGFSAAASAGTAAVQAKGTNGGVSDILAAAVSAATNAAGFISTLNTAAVLQARSMFSDPRYVQAVYSVGLAAASGAAAVANTNANVFAARMAATNAALAAFAAAPNLTSPVSAAYNGFLASSAFQTNVPQVVTAAVAAAAGGPSPDAVNAARSAGLKLLFDHRAFAAAEALTLNEVQLSGQLAPGGRVTGRLYLGASHPTNPFRHRRHPDHTIGMTIARQVTFEVGTNAAQRVGFGVDRLTGIYKEEITGLHKPLGPEQNIGLKTEGTFTLNRVSLVDTLNQ